MLSDLLLSEIETGQGEYLTQAARRLPPSRLGRPVTLSCVFRCIVGGVRGPGGERIRLEGARLAGKWITTPGALRRFIEAQTPRTEPNAFHPRTAARAQRAAERAGERLKRMGC
jgi:hypothetical protein